MAGKKSWRRATGMLIASVAGSLLLVTPGMVEAQSGTVVGTPGFSFVDDSFLNKAFDN